MAEKQQAIKEKIEFSGLFDFKALYSFAHSWFKEGRYGVTEEKYSEKVTKENKKDIEIEWLASKDISDYFKVENKIKFEISGLSEVEAEIDGKRKKMNEGRISIEITGTLIKDKDSKWDTSPMYRFMRDVYNKFIIPFRINELKGELTNDVISFKEEIKAFLDLTGKR